MPRLILIVVAVPVLGFAPVPFPKPHLGPDRKAIQGLWYSAPTPHRKGVWLRIDEKWLDFVSIRQLAPGILFLNPEAYPKEFDVRGSESSEPSSGMRGIYKLKKDTLTISFNGVCGEPRPRAFHGEGVGEVTWVFKRMRE